MNMRRLTNTEGEFSAVEDIPKKACAVSSNGVKGGSSLPEPEAHFWHRVFALRGLESLSKHSQCLKFYQQFPSTREHIARPGVLAGKAAWLWP
jgi:hypothetical protein